MVFRFLHIHGDAGKCYITGCFERCKEGTPEKELLDVLAECIVEANASFKSDKIVIKDNTVFFRAVDADWLFSALQFWDKCIDLSLVYRLNKNVVFSGDNARKIFEDVKSKYKIGLVKEK